MRVPGPIRVSSFKPVQGRSVELAACSGNSDFTQLQTKITQFESSSFLWKSRCIVTNTLNVQPMQVPGPIRRSLVMPIQRALCGAGRIFTE